MENKWPVLLFEDLDNNFLKKIWKTAFFADFIQFTWYILNWHLTPYRRNCERGKTIMAGRWKTNLLSSLWAFSGEKIGNSREYIIHVWHQHGATDCLIVHFPSCKLKWIPSVQADVWQNLDFMNGTFFFFSFVNRNVIFKFRNQYVNALLGSFYLLLMWLCFKVSFII